MAVRRKSGVEDTTWRCGRREDSVVCRHDICVEEDIY